MRYCHGAHGVLIDPQTGKVHALNYTAVAIWELCDGESGSIGMRNRLPAKRTR